MNWTQKEAIELCVKIESVAPKFGCHVALTGGCLYGGSLKDCDIIIYRIRQAASVDYEALWNALEQFGITMSSGFGFCHKATINGKRIDFLSPEEAEGIYGDEEEPII